jgi:GT2 family glycosyltransferase
VEKNEKVTVGWIDPGTVYTGFVAYISQLFLHRSDRISDVSVASGPYLSANRNNMVTQFLATDSDWLLALDSDLCITLESFDSLIKKADKDKYPIIGGKYFIPFNNGSDLVLAAQAWHPSMNGGGEFIHEYKEDEILEDLHSIGAGYMLIHRSVFEKIAKAYPENPVPWFQDEWRSQVYNSWISDDIFFFERVHKVGFKVALDTKATSTHLKYFKVDESTYLKVKTRLVAEHIENHHPTSYAAHKRTSWWTKGKGK